MAFLAAALPYLAAAGTVVSAVGAYQQGKAAKSAAQYNTVVNTQNAEIATTDATLRSKQVARDNILRSGQLRAAQGASGGTADEGSVLDVLGDVAAQGELEKQYTQYQGDLAARGYKNTAALDYASGNNAYQGGVMRAGSELLTGGVSAYRLGQLKRV